MQNNTEHHDNLMRLLEMGEQKSASDLLLVAGSPPCYYVNGSLELLDAPELNAAEVERLLQPLLDEDRRTRLLQHRDLDFSLDGTLDTLGEIAELRTRFESLLEGTFRVESLHVFDVRFEKCPPNLKEDVLGDFWGGYKLRFKVIGSDSADELTLESQRRQAFSLGEADRKEFTVDLSKHEFCGDKRLKVIDGFNVYVYSDRMIICEKIRAICQQMAEYRDIVKSSSARPRAKDFFDIHHISSSIEIDFTSDEFWDTLQQIFTIKRVPIELLGKIDDHREFHRDDFQSVKDTVLASVRLKDFDFYVNYLLDRLAPLQPRWEVDLPPV
ncbi:MAG: nucleotidyl transferase AbiEii/AbiGii toxin family protein [Planctomycetes bacterium]|nr:nucleotidyl transferase AbiEii/AbiGii toxin family protein [Planctomycetota bacterium]